MARNNRSVRSRGWTRLISATLLMLAASGTDAQVRLPPITTAPKSACGSLSNPPTDTQCWNCYLERITQCYQTFHTPEAQLACFNGAQVLLEQCGSRVSRAGRSVSSPGLEVTQGQLRVFDRRSYLHLKANTLDIIDPSQISVYLIRDHEGSAHTVNIDQAAHVSSDNWHDFDVAIDPILLDLEAGEVIGLIVAVNNPVTRIPIHADAVALKVVDSYDLNGDGVFDSRDYLAAMIRYGNGQLDTETFYLIAGEYRRR